MSVPSGIANIKQVDLSAIVNRSDIDAFIHILDRRGSGSLKARGAANKIKEKIGEDSALKHIQRRFPGSQPIAVVRRANGVPVLDLLLEAPDGKFIIVEAKYSTSGELRLGKTNGKAFIITNQGPVPIKVKGGTRQMSPQWIRNRYMEMQRIGKHDKDIRQLGKRLQVALHQGRFHAISVVTDSTGEVLLEKNHTNEWLRSFTSEGTEFRHPRTFAQSAPKAKSSSGEIETKAPKDPFPSNVAGSRLTEGSRGTSTTQKPRPSLGIGTPTGKAITFRLSFSGNLLFEALKLVLFSILEAMLDKTNQEMLAGSYKTLIFHPYILDDITKELNNAEKWSKVGQNHRRTLYHSYWVHMEHHTKTKLGNWVSFIGMGFKVPRSFVKVEAIPEMTSSAWSRELIPLVHISEREKTNKKRVYRYKYTHRLLVWDYDVFQFAKILISIQTSTIKFVNEAAKDSSSIKELVLIGEIDKHLENYDFLAAFNILPKTRIVHSKYGDQIHAFLNLGEFQIAQMEPRYHTQQKTLLSLYLDRNPFTKLRKKIKDEAERKKQQELMRSIYPG